MDNLLLRLSIEGKASLNDQHTCSPQPPTGRTTYTIIIDCTYRAPLVPYLSGQDRTHAPLGGSRSTRKTCIASPTGLYHNERLCAPPPAPSSAVFSENVQSCATTVAPSVANTAAPLSLVAPLDRSRLSMCKTAPVMLNNWVIPPPSTVARPDAAGTPSYTYK